MSSRRWLTAMAVLVAVLAGCAPPAPMVGPPEPLLPGASDGLDPEALAEAEGAGDGSAAAPDGVGDPGMGDPYYPTSGNGGYQVAGYDLAITYDPESNALDGVARITMVVTSAEPLTRFHLDLQPTMTVDAVTVDGEEASTARDDAELVIEPAQPLAPGATAVVEVGYAGEPQLIPGGTAGLGDGGWYRTESGGALVAGEPAGASAWFPANEHPADAAIYRVTTTVPQEWDVISNGLETAPLEPAPDGWHTRVWEIADPIASYLVTLWIDRFERFTGTTEDGIPVISAATSTSANGERLHEYTPEAVAALVELLGPYPYDTVGGIYVDEDLPFALETATRPVYAPWAEESVVVHELAHQWYGNLVRPLRWADICLSECFASYLEWLVSEASGDLDINDLWADYWDFSASSETFWESPLVDMGPGNEFGSVYDRGPMALHVLRLTMGDEAFFELIRRWPADHAEQAVTFDDLVALADELSDADLDPVFDVWFRATVAPSPEDVPEPLR